MSEQELIHDAREWRDKVYAYRTAHFRAGDSLRRLHYAIGLVLIGLTSVASASILKSIGDTSSGTLQWTTGIIALVAAVLTSVQTTFKLGERAEAHRSTAVAFGNIYRNLEIFIDSSHPSPDEAAKTLLSISTDIQNVETGAPAYFGRTYDRALRKIRETRAGDA